MNPVLWGELLTREAVRDKTVLVLPCGSGRNSRIIADLGAAKVHACDICPKNIDFCRAHDAGVVADAAAAAKFAAAAVSSRRTRVVSSKKPGGLAFRTRTTVTSVDPTKAAAAALAARRAEVIAAKAATVLEYSVADAKNTTTTPRCCSGVQTHICWDKEAASPVKEPKPLARSYCLRLGHSVTFSKTCKQWFTQLGPIRPFESSPRTMQTMKP